MKKLLLCTLSFVALSLLFISCDPNNPENKNPLVGTWKYKTAPSPDSGWWGLYTFTFNADGTFAYIDEAHAPGSEEMHDGFIWRGTYEVKDDIITLHKDKMGQLIDGKEAYYDDWTPEDEQMKFRIDGTKLYLTRAYGSDLAWEEIYNLNDPLDPEPVNPLAGLWIYEDGPEGEFHYKHAVSIGEGNDFEYTLKALFSEDNIHYGYTWDGNFEHKDDTVTLHFEHQTWYLNWDEENFEPHTEQFVYSVEGNTMTINWLNDGGYDRPTQLVKQ